MKTLSHMRLEQAPGGVLESVRGAAGRRFKPAGKTRFLGILVLSSFLLSSLEFRVTKVYEPEIRARLGIAAHFCEVLVFWDTLCGFAVEPATFSPIAGCRTLLATGDGRSTTRA